MKIFKLEVIVCDPSQQVESVTEVIDNLEHGMRDWVVQVVSGETKDDGRDWDDNHPCNYTPLRASNYYKKIGAR